MKVEEETVFVRDPSVLGKNNVSRMRSIEQKCTKPRTLVMIASVGTFFVCKCILLFLKYREALPCEIGLTCD